MDQFDQASELEQIARDYAITTQQRKFSELKTAPGAETALDCLEYGNEIPEPRRQALPGIMRCIECQQLEEDRMKKYAK